MERSEIGTRLVGLGAGGGGGFLQLHERALGHGQFAEHVFHLRAERVALLRRRGGGLARLNGGAIGGVLLGAEAGDFAS